MKALWAVPVFLVGMQMPVPAQTQIVPNGAEVVVRTNQPIDAREADGRIYTGTVERDLLDRDGRVAIPRGSQVELIARRLGDGDIALDLDSITSGGRRYTVASSNPEIERSGSEREGVGKNERTAKYLGGGAIIGSIIGAIAGGGKGAAIGAAAGAATGAGAQMATRGREIRVPAESLLTYRLDQPIRVVEGPDPGYMRNGNHYHRYPPEQGSSDRYYRDRP